MGLISPIAKRQHICGTPYFHNSRSHDPCKVVLLCTPSLSRLLLRCVSTMIRIRAPSIFRGTYRAGVQQQRQQYQQHHNNVDVVARPHLLGNQRFVVSTKSAGGQRREPRRRLPEKPGLKVFCRHFASASGGGSSGSSSSSSGDRNRSYLERWAGIRGRVASGTKASLQGTGTCTYIRTRGIDDVEISHSEQQDRRSNGIPVPS